MCNGLFDVLLSNTQTRRYGSHAPFAIDLKQFRTHIRCTHTHTHTHTHNVFNQTSLLPAPKTQTQTQTQALTHTHTHLHTHHTHENFNSIETKSSGIIHSAARHARIDNHMPTQEIKRQFNNRQFNNRRGVGIRIYDGA